MPNQSPTPSTLSLPEHTNMLTHEQAAKFYDALGAKQGWQVFFEVPSMRDLIAHGNFEGAHTVVEFGRGTGAFAEAVLVATFVQITSQGCKQHPIPSDGSPKHRWGC